MPERVNLLGLNSVQIHSALITASLGRKVKNITLLGEPIWQRLFCIYTVLSLIYVEYSTSIALPCLNTKQTAAEIDRKAQHALILDINYGV